tara:strand:+ start:181 stop:390 length:210 start_codon:yes stop_codon:yes gene_type:complete
MAVPKRRRSKARKRTHKSLWKINKPTTRPCPDCGVLSYPHFMCKECGYYNGKLIIAPKIKKEKQPQKDN